MNTNFLAQEYLKRSKKRLKAVLVLFQEKSYADVVRESQEIVELCGKGILRLFGIDPPKFHDVSNIMLELSKKYKQYQKDFKKYSKISKWLRKERELAFYGEVDFIPSEEYTKNDAKKAIEGAKFSIDLLNKLLNR